MKVQILGITRMKGVGKKSQQPYDMCNIKAAIPQENVNTDSMKKNGYGFDVAEIRADPQCIESFRDLKFPCMVTLKLEQEFRYGKMEQICVGFSQA